MTDFREWTLLLCGVHDNDFDFLRPMLARNRTVRRHPRAGDRVCVVGYQGGVAEAAARSVDPRVESCVLIIDRPLLSVPQSSVPTLLIGGRGSGVEALAAQLADARFAGIAVDGYLLVQRPAQVLSLIEQFLDDPLRYPAGTNIPEERP